MARAWFGMLIIIYTTDSEGRDITEVQKLSGRLALGRKISMGEANMYLPCLVTGARKIVKYQ